MFFPHRPLLLLSLLLTASSCNEQKSSATKAPPLKQVAQELIPQLGKSLKSELQAAMKKGGPTLAVEACAIKAPVLSAAASTEGYRVRRIGTRVRNPDNSPSEKELKILKKLTKASPTYEEEGKFYQAIFTGPLCLTCHGDPADMSNELSAVLSKKYPEDRALGYKLGELRGAFVVEAK